MKRIVVFCLIGVATLDAWGAMSNLQQPAKAFSAVVWKTTTLHSPAGKTTTFMQRTVYIRDASGTLRAPA